MVRELRRSPQFYATLLTWLALTYVATVINGDTMFLSVMVYANRLPILAELLVSVLAGTLAIFLTISIRQYSLAESLRFYFVRINDDGAVFRVLVATANFVLFMACFLYWKMKIPQVHPFSWDGALAKADAFLLGGKQGWEFLMPYLGSERTTRFFDFLYGLWALICVIVWVMVGCLHRLPPQARNHYWLATILTWLIVGLGFATIFSSAGPVYYHHVTGNSDLFAGLREYLNGFDTPLLTTGAQNILWDIHAGVVNGAGGISAMPSMHNAQALLFVLIAFHMGRVYQIFFGLFAVGIFLASVHLGWHYMVDGLAPFAIVPPIWYLAGRITGSSTKRTHHHGRARAGQI